MSQLLIFSRSVFVVYVLKLSFSSSSFLPLLNCWCVETVFFIFILCLVTSRGISFFHFCFNCECCTDRRYSVKNQTKKRSEEKIPKPHQKTSSFILPLSSFYVQNFCFTDIFYAMFTSSLIQLVLLVRKQN